MTPPGAPSYVCVLCHVCPRGKGLAGFVQSEHTDKNVLGLTRIPWHLMFSFVFSCVSVLPSVSLVPVSPCYLTWVTWWRISDLDSVRRNHPRGKIEINWMA